MEDTIVGRLPLKILYIKCLNKFQVLSECFHVSYDINVEGILALLTCTQPQQVPIRAPFVLVFSLFSMAASHR